MERDRQGIGLLLHCWKRSAGEGFGVKSSLGSVELRRAEVERGRFPAVIPKGRAKKANKCRLDRAAHFLFPSALVGKHVTRPEI